MLRNLYVTDKFILNVLPTVAFYTHRATRPNSGLTATSFLLNYMNRLTKFTLTAAAVFTLCSLPTFASSGIFGTGVVISLNIGGAPALDLFETTLLGDSRQNPANPGDGGVSLGSPTLVTSGGWSNTGSGGFSLGTFNVVTGDTLTLDGAEVLTFKNGGSDVTGALLGYAIDGSFGTEKGLAFNEDNVNGNTGDQRWYSDSTADVNLLSGLSVGTHTLTVYYHATTSDGDKFENNGGGNFTASFTVVPEPSSLMMMLSSGLFGTFYLIRRRRK